jgi:glycosyltransferase involved in cell wall biosynthesis
MAAPSENQAAKLIHTANAGLVVPPDSSEEFLSAACELMENPEERMLYAQNARVYAESHFDIVRIADRFLPLFEK